MRFYIVSLILDLLFIFIACFIVCLCVFYYFIAYPFSIIVSVSVALIITVFASKILLTKQGKTKLKEKDKKSYLESMIRLNLMKENKLIDLFVLAIAKSEKVSKIKNGFYHYATNTLYIVKFCFEGITKKDVVKAFNQLEHQEDKVVFYCESYSQEIKDFAQRFNGKITLLDGKDAFHLLKDSNLLPTEDFSSYYKEKKKVRFKTEILDRKNAKKFFLFGAVFCAFSFFVPIKAYYLFCGCAMMTFAVFLKLFGKTQVKKD